MPVPWTKIEPYFQQAYEAQGQVEREDVINLAFAEDESDEVIDAIDAIGSRVFRSVDDARQFLKSQDWVED